MENSVVTRLLDNQQPARFEARCSVDEAIRRLDDIVEPSRLGSPFQQHIFGRVTRDGVYLERVTPLFKNSWRPAVEGRFEVARGVTVLVGSFGLSKSTRRFMKLFVAFGFLWTIGAGWSVLAHPQPELPVWFPFAGIGIACVGVAMSKVFAAASAGDVEWLSTKVSEQLDR